MLLLCSTFGLNWECTILTIQYTRAFQFVRIERLFSFSSMTNKKMTTQIQHISKATYRLPKVGNTPLLLINSLSTNKVRIWAKAEWEQPGGSVKARAAHAIISKAI